MFQNHFFMKSSFSSSNCVLYFDTSTDKIIWCLSDTSVNSMFSWIIFLFLWNLGWFSSTSLSTLFFINSYTFPTKNTTFLLFNFFFNWGLSFWRFLIIKWRGKININIGINDTNSIVRCFGINLKNINIKLFIKSCNCNCVALMQACKVSQLIFQYSFWITCFNEFSSVRSKFNHILCLWTLSFHIGN